MKFHNRSWFAALLAMPLLLASGCGQTSDLPPGGAQAVAYWHGVLLQYPDLPDKVRAIVERRGYSDWVERGLPQFEVRIYGQDEVVTVAGRHVDVVVTDLDEASLRKLLAWWESVPRLAKELDLQAVLPFSIPSSTQHVVVLGREGRIDVSGPSGDQSQSIHIVANEAVGQTTIGIHAFGPNGQRSLDDLASQYERVRGPPRSEVRAGRISLPPPEDNVTVLVIGQLGSLNIDGPEDDARQQVSFAAYLNSHQSPGEVAGVLAGTPFEAEFSDSTVTHANGDYPTSASPGESPPVSTSAAPLAVESPVSTASLPAPLTLPGQTTFQPPIELPRNDFRMFQPPTVIHVPPPVVQPPPVFVPRFR